MNTIKRPSALPLITFMFAVLVVLSGCSSAPKKAEVVEIQPKDSNLVAKPVLLEEEKTQYKKGLELISAESYVEAEAIFTELLAKHPQLAGAYVNLGLIQQNQKNIGKAKELYNKALSINPENTNALVQLAVMNQAEGRFKESEQLLLKAHAKQTENTVVNYNLGVLYELYLQDYDKAIRHYQLYVQHSDNEDTKTVERWIKILERK